MILLQNTVIASPGEYGKQAVALRITGDKAMFYKVKVVGAQDTLLDESGSHYFYQCYIQGSVDFIFGKSRSLYQVNILLKNCEISFIIMILIKLDSFETGLSDYVHC